MPYSETLAARTRVALGRAPGLEAKKMMGGLTYMVNGKMCVGVLNDDLMCRIDPDIHEAALQKKGCREMDFTGKPMRGFIFVDPVGTKSDSDLKKWVNLSLEFNGRAKASTKKKK